MITLADDQWVAIDQGSFLPSIKYRRFIRVAILEYHPPFQLPRRFWAFIDRLSSIFYIEEEADPSLKVVEPKELHDDLWNFCADSGLLNIIIPYEEAPIIYANREASIDKARKEYIRRQGQWQKEK